ncbi:MAG: efflux RND transporter periplasmic adaptor subunit [Gemmatimonadota bacterium]
MMNASPQGGRAARRLVAAIAFAALAPAGCAVAPEPQADEPGSVVVTQWNDSTELFLEYPHLLAGEPTGNWAIHLTDMQDFKPIRAGALTVRFLDGPAAQRFTVADVARDGIFLLDPVVERPGTYTVELTLESPQARSRHVLSEVKVYADEGELPRAEEEAAGGIAFLKEQQWQIPFAVTAVGEETVRRTVAAPGEIVAPDGALVLVSAPVDGIAAAGANRSAPSVGQTVRAGQVLAVLSPTTQEGGFAQIRASVERLEREVARAERLYEAGAIAEKRLEEARHDLAVTRAQAASLGASGTAGDYLLRITSPISGVVARRAFVPGGRVAAGESLFTIVDPRNAWLRAHVPASVAASVPADATAFFTVEGDEAIHETARLISVGSVLDPETRTVPVTFLLADGGRPIAFGQLAQAAVPTGDAVTGIVIPNRAIIDDNGTPVAYVQAGGETFERRVLTLGATDGAVTQVVAGIDSGEMVVTTGAYQVRLASMSGGDFAGGHAH